MRADDLLAAVFPDQAACAENLTGEIRIPDHPLVNETIENCLHEAMDLDGLRAVLTGCAMGRSERVAIDTPEPSPFSHEILNANPYAYLDDAPLEERRARAVQLRRTLRTDFSSEGAGALDPAAIAPVAAEAWPAVRDADELHDALLGLGVMPVAEGELALMFDELAARRRATVMTVPTDSGDDARAFGAATGQEACRTGQGARFGSPPSGWIWCAPSYPDARFEPAIAAPASTRAIPETPERCAAEILRGWFECSGPLRASDSRAIWRCRAIWWIRGSAQLEAEGQILRGRFTTRDAERRDRMVPSPLAGAHSSADHRPAAARDRAGHHGGVLRVPASLAAPFAGQPVAWRGWHAADHQAAAGMRVSGGGVGSGSAAAARSRITIRNISISFASRAK